MHEPINVESLNNTSKWQMGFNSAFKGLKYEEVQPFLTQEIWYFLACKISRAFNTTGPLPKQFDFR
jgi:hypothetical protein